MYDSSVSRFEPAFVVAPLSLVASSMAGCATEVDGASHVARLKEPVIYGTDDRHELYEETDEALGAVARDKIVGLVPIDALRDGATGPDFEAPSAREVFDLCSGERYADQPSVPVCTGVLVGDFVLTASHCVRALDCEKTLLLRGFYYEAPGELRAIGANDVRRCSRVIALETSGADGSRLDYAWLGLDHPFEQDGELRLASAASLVEGSRLTTIGHGGGLPTKIDASGTLIDARAQRGDYFIAEIDNFAGGSGAGVFDEHGQLLGVAVRGRGDFELTPDGCAITRTLPAGAGAEEVTYAERARAGLCAREPRAAAWCPPPARGSDSGSCSVRTRDRSGDGVLVVGLAIAATALLRRRTRPEIPNLPP
jgi:hypothetical protein